MWFVLILLLALFPQSIWAQEASTSATPVVSDTPAPTAVPTIDPYILKIQQYQADYDFQKNQFNAAYTIYVTKKQVHTKYGTVITQREKQEATRAALIARNNMLSSYLLLLRVTLDKFKPANPTDTEKQQIDLSKWEDYLKEQNSIVSSLGNDQDFAGNTNKFKEKYIPMQQTIYSSLVINQINRQKIIQDQIKTLRDSILSANPKPEGLQPVSEVAIKLDLSNSNLDNALKTTQKDQNGETFSNFYPSSQTYLIQAEGYLREILNNLKGVVLKYL